MCQCVMMIDRTLATSLMQRQAEFRSIGRKMLFREQTNNIRFNIRASVYLLYRFIYQLENVIKQTFRKWRADKEVWRYFPRRMRRNVLNNQHWHIAWRIDNIISPKCSFQSPTSYYSIMYLRQNGYKSHDIHALRQFPVIFSRAFYLVAIRHTHIFFLQLRHIVLIDDNH